MMALGLVPLAACDDGMTRQMTAGATGGETEDKAATEDASQVDLHAIQEDADGNVECSVLAALCHDFDLGTGDLGDICHDIGHAGDADVCKSMYDECLDLCLVQ